MKKQRDTLISLFLTAFLVMFISGSLLSADAGESIYGHISYVDKDATVIRQDKTEHKAVVNLPVAPGDQVVTGEKGRCELQFDNGTIIRLDNDSRLKVTTVLAPSLTSRWKITTLHLMRGGLCSMNSNYNREMFQIITPNAALDFKKRSTSFIRMKDSGDTFIFAQRGKFKVMFGEDVDSLKTETIRAKKGYTITADHQMRIDEGKRDFDFVAWNEYVNRNFKDLHYGISKVPKKIYRYNKALVYWAEKWSSLFGEWVYDDILGYVWKPADEYFAWAARPFFHADFTYVNGEMFVVPQQPWGWIPAHMGTWVWMKWGWTWVPGSAFSPGLYSGTFSGYSFMYPRSWYYPTMEYWITCCYGSYDLYYTYRDYGVKVWRENYQKKYKTYKKEPGLKKIPKPIRALIGKMNKAPVRVVKERLGTEPRLAMIGMKKLAPLLKSVKPAVKVNKNKKIVSTSAKTSVNSNKISASSVINPEDSIRSKESKGFKFKARGGGVRVPLKGFRDWNPDSQWASYSGHKIVYSSKNNEVVCPSLGLSSKTITPMQRAALKRSSPGSSRGRSSTQASSSSSSGSSSSNGSTSTSSSSSRGGGGGKSGSSRGGSAAKK
jgi:uncharacterized membrane protein YgcG